jgi:hypothetical protein
LSLKNQNF